jgi:uncharacterized membrane protein (DUF106 family)
MVLNIVPSVLSHPAVVILLIGASISVFMNLINKKVLSTKRAKEVKQKMQEIRSVMLDAQKCGDTKKMNECVRDLMKINSEYFRFMIKPMFISVLIFIIITPFLRGNFTGRAIATVPGTIPVIGGFEMSWFWWYAICAFVVSMIARKILGI